MSSNLDIDFTAKVLQNEGVPVPLQILDESGSPSFDADGEIRVEFRAVRMTAATMMGIESEFSGYTVRESVPELVTKQELVTDPTSGETSLQSRTRPTGATVSEERVFYGAEAFEERGKREPFVTVIKALSLCLGEKESWVAERLLTNRMEYYFIAITGAIQLAQGVDPFQIQRLLESSEAALVAAKRANDAGISILVQENDAAVEQMEKALRDLEKTQDGLPGTNG